MDWLVFSFKDLLDILLVGLLLYYVYDVLRKSGSGTLFGGIIALIVIWVVTSQLLRMRLLGGILDALFSVGIVVIVIIFQDDIKRFLNVLGSTQRWRFFRKLFRTDKDASTSRGQSFIGMISFACANMARKKTGALIVIEQETSLEQYIHTGEIINAKVNSRLMENIFFKNAPLHDGAMIIRDYTIVAAACILPVAQGQELPKEMGLRHRSGLGMSQATDAKVIIISEERGEISIAYRGEMIANVDTDQLQQFLSPNFIELSKIGTIITKTGRG
ncbi:diadenylate cyclase CdaA [Porphyromonas levii]|uniref:diadenylate cyclase CdaA n=1 Tax=Porphyromonas levii TaxID=28114 RepID=UPI001B8C0651|nr:diadenylate cyclase CdaA [Porphyromonas levii]MBR8729890.1 Cyclic di-AMP synthase CdaA [Porphyromonas levii]MBR8806756.1 Cyclic di-AMP synthase CdaA [Porphyromonas levii]